MLFFLPLLGLVLVWAWWSGRLKGVTLDDAIALAVFLLGLRFLTTGRTFLGAGLMAAGLLYGGFRRGRFARQGMPLDDARRLLGVPADAGTDEIRAAHRRLIARVHPDTGGSEELARRINAARDALIADAARASPRRGPLR
jgi:DnaJ family protein C protein 19